MRGTPWRGLGALGVVIGAGALLGHAAASGPEPTRRVMVGPATLEVPSAWATVNERELVVASEQRVAMTFGAPAARSLAPLPLRGAPGGPARPTRLAGYRAVRSGDLTLLPTSRGVLAISCPDSCAAQVRSISVRAAAVLPPAPDLALRLGAGPALARLDANRVRLREQLRAAGSGAQQARTARELADLHRAALASLRPLSSPSAPLVGALERAARAYDALGRAAVPARFEAAGAAVSSADASVEQAVTRLTGPLAVQRAVDAPGEGDGPGLGTIALVTALGLLASLLVPAGRRRSRTVAEPRSRSSALPRQQPVDAEPERRPPAAPPRPPIAPPPTFGRWDETPTDSPRAPVTGVEDQLSGRPSSYSRASKNASS